MKRPVISVLCIAFFASSVFAQSLKTGKKYVTAIVDPGQGWVQVKLFPGTPLSGTLTYSKKSFVTFLVNGTYYTNNDVGLAPFPANAKLLTDGVLSQIGDTIRCVWPNKGGVDLIQEVYPVLFDHSEQIVYCWKAVNKTSSPVTVSVQYLLDVQVGDENYVNDGAPILTRYGYRPIWDQFTRSTNFGIPWFYIAFQYSLPNAPTFNPGISGQGYLDNVNVNLGLTQPWRQTVGDWNQLIQAEWGPPAPLPSGTYADAATLLEFDPGTAIPNKEVLIARTSYGTGEFAICKGLLFGVMFYPEKVGTGLSHPVTNPFQLDFYVFNPFTVQGAPNTSLTLNVGPHLTILTPTPVTNGGKTQTQSFSIFPLGVTNVLYTIKYDTAGIADSSFLSSLRFNAVSPGIGSPIFVNDATGSDTCEHPLIINSKPTKIIDVTKPFSSNIIEVDNFSQRFTASDNRTADSGLASIAWVYSAGADSNNFTVDISPPVVKCSKASHTILVTRKDSTKGGCLDFTLKDCANNVTTLSVCFDSSVVPNKRDTIPPKVEPIVKGSADTIKFITHDYETQDSGLQAIEVLESTLGNYTFTINPPLTPCSKSAHIVTVVNHTARGIGCVFFKITDCANNVTYDSICFTSDSTSGISKESGTSFSFQLLPNPASEKVTILYYLKKDDGSMLQMTDILGHIVRTERVAAVSEGENEYQLDLRGLNPGSYIVRAESGGNVVSHILKIVR